MIRLTTGIFSLMLSLLSGIVYRIISLTENKILLDIIMYVVIFVCIFTSEDWGHTSRSGEILNLDRVKFGQFNVYYMISALLFSILFLKAFVLKKKIAIWGNSNYLKNIFWMFFVPVNLLTYLTIYLKNIELMDLGVRPIVVSFVFLVTTIYVQDVFLKDKDSKQLDRILMVVQIMILIRCIYSIAKYHLGLGYVTVELGLRIGQENDFADYFLLLFIIAAASLLFEKNNNKIHRLFHVISLIATTYVILFARRRYLWVEWLVASNIVLFFHYWFNKSNINKKTILACFIIMILFSAVFFIGPEQLEDNPYIGRLLSSLSLIDKGFESEYGKQQGHVDEILDGWLNVKKHWFLGITHFGRPLLDRPRTASWQKGLFVHNAYIQVWLVYGLLGIILFLSLYIKSIQLGYFVFFRLKNTVGLIVLTFMICQMIKNIVWPTALRMVNLTIIYILIISIGLKSKELLSRK